MKKKLLAAVLSASLGASVLVACGDNNGGDGAVEQGYTLSSSQLLDNPTTEFFADSTAAVVASKERAWDGAKLAVSRGVPLIVGEAPEGMDLSSDEVSDLTTGAPEEPAPKDIAAAIAALPLPEGAENPANSVNAVATATTDVAKLATARAAGAEIEILPVADPRASQKVMDGENVVALGEEFGTQEKFDSMVEMASWGEVAGGGGLVFPGKRMIALYGHPSGPALGVMGEQPPAEAVKRAQDLVAQYQQYEELPIIPAFEIITTVAAVEPGPDGNYSNETAIEDIQPYVDAITQAGGYAVLDLQPGTGKFIDQAKMYAPLLENPNVGLALDPEWQIQPGETPAARVGNTTAQEINEVSEWLAGFVREKQIPQKMLILHQFQLQMIRDREQLNVDHPELAIVLHADGHGAPEQKFDTWNVLKQGLQPEIFLAWKNFIDEDTPMFDPRRTYETVDPRPWFVSYQ